LGQKPYLSAAKIYTKYIILAVDIYLSAAKIEYSKYILATDSFINRAGYMAKNHKPFTNKPGSNGNPFYCLNLISPILAAGCVKFAIKRLE
jgi:hypothetical protein